MKIQKIERGIHTVELYAKNLKYTQVQKVIDRQSSEGRIYIHEKNFYGIDRYAEFQCGVTKVLAHQSHDKSNGVGFIFSPSSFLEGEDIPAALYEPDESSCKEILNGMKLLMREIGLETNRHKLVVEPKQLSLSQMDLTMNIWFDKETDLTEIIRLFRKGNIPPGFKRHSCGRKGEKDADSYCFVMKSKSITFKVYAKIHELKQTGRCPFDLWNKNILRIEVSLKRKEFLRKLGLKKDDSLYKMMQTGYDSLESVLVDYIQKIFPCSGKHVRFRDAKKAVQAADLRPIHKEQMPFLLHKTSKGKGLDIALQKLKKKYKIKDKRTVDKLLAKFDELGINPIALRNSSSYRELPIPLSMVRDRMK